MMSLPAAWTSGNGGSAWNRAVGATPAVFSRPGSQQLVSVTHGSMGWLAVGQVTAGAAEHPVVVVSAFAAPPDRRAAIEAGATRFVKKPFDPEALRSLVEELLPPAA